MNPERILLSCLKLLTTILKRVNCFVEQVDSLTASICGNYLAKEKELSLLHQFRITTLPSIWQASEGNLVCYVSSQC